MNKTIITVAMIIPMLLANITVQAQLKAVTLGTTTLSKNAAAVDHYVANEIIVKYRDTVNAATMLNAALLHGHSINNLSPQSQLQSIQFSSTENIDQVLASYNSDPNVLFAEPNYLYKLAAIIPPTDVDYSKQWALSNTDFPNNDIDAENAWAISTDCTANNTVIAILDTGVNYLHDDLKNNIWINPGEIANDGIDNDNNGYIDDVNGWDFNDNDNTPMDLHGHGTHIAGTIAAQANNNNIGTVGVCWNAKIMVLRLGDAAGGGISGKRIADAVAYGIKNGATIMNMSFGGRNNSTLIHDAVTKARDSGIILAIAAGNENTDNDNSTTPSYPCNYKYANRSMVVDKSDELDNIICVGAVNRKYDISSFSNYGVINVDIAAPGGGSIITDGPLNTADQIYSTWSTVSTEMFSQVGFGAILDTFTAWSFDPLVSPWLETAQANPQLQSFRAISDPSGYDIAYTANQNNTLYRSMLFPQADAYVLTSIVRFNLPINSNDSDTSGQVYGIGNTVPRNTVSELLGSNIAVLEASIPTTCSGQTCSFGFNLQSDGNSIVAKGVDILMMKLDSKVLSNSAYNGIQGTSMAAPHVAAVAALVQSYNPNYKYQDVIKAVIEGGDSVTLLSSKIRSGNTLNALGSITYISNPVINSGSFKVK